MNEDKKSSVFGDAMYLVLSSDKLNNILYKGYLTLIILQFISIIIEESCLVTTHYLLSLHCPCQRQFNFETDPCSNGGPVNIKY